VTLTATPGAGYEFERWDVLGGGVVLSNRDLPQATFLMPGNDVFIMAHFKPAQSRYSITVAPSLGGSAEANLSSAEQGAAILMVISPDAGFEFDYLEVSSGGLTIGATAEPWFTMPNSDVTVRVYFRPAGG